MSPKDCDQESREALLSASPVVPLQKLGYQIDETSDFDSDGEESASLKRDLSRRALLSKESPTRVLRILTSWHQHVNRKVQAVLLVLVLGVASWTLMSRHALDRITHPPGTIDGMSPPWYPTPLGGTSERWRESYRRAAELVGNMTLLEKVNITTGTGWQMGLAVGNTGPAAHVGFPALALQDGPLGLRFEGGNSTAWPAGITVGATWNRDLMYARGKGHGKEARQKGINVLLGPAVGPLGRMPCGGRVWEGFGADPYLQGVAAAQTIRGIQGEGVMATIKHLVGNEQEHFRQALEWGLPTALSSNIDDRTLHELYGWPFADAVHAGVASVMCSYQMVNNSYSCQNSKLLNGYLKDELGFQGFVQSDWLAQRGGVASALAGLDMSMPGDGLLWAKGDSLWGSELTKSVLNGSVPMERMNDMATRIVAAYYQLGQDDTSLFDGEGPNFSSWTRDEMGHVYEGSPDDDNLRPINKFLNVTSAEHAQLARRIAVEGTVLLKNDGVLPLNQNDQLNRQDLDHPLRVAILGEDAGEGSGPNSCPDRSCNQGTLGSGWGSGAVDFPYLVSPASALETALNSSNVRLTTHANNLPPTKKAPEVLGDQDICIVFVNADSGEGYLKWEGIRGDRNDLYLQKGGEELIVEVAEACGDGQGSTIVVIHAVGPVVMDQWIHMQGIKAVIMANLPGQESGNAIADILLGDANPSGKLPYTIGKSLDDYGPGAKVLYYPNGVVPQQDFTEGLYIDYRHFDREGITPTFEFGFGLSYTTFEYSNLTITPLQAKSAFPAHRSDKLSPPRYNSTLPDPESALFPKGFRRLAKVVYPYIEKLKDITPGSYVYPVGWTTKQTPSPAGGEQGGNPDLWTVYARVDTEISNTGNLAGQEVVQLYLSYENIGTGVDTPGSEHQSANFPVRVLRGFHKVHLGVGETRSVSFDLTRRDLSYWDVHLQNWVMPVEGSFTINIGASSRDLRLKGSL